MSRCFGNIEVILYYICVPHDCIAPLWGTVTCTSKVDTDDKLRRCPWSTD